MSDQPNRFALLGQEPVATIDRGALKDKLDRKEPIKLIMKSAGMDPAVVTAPRAGTASGGFRRSAWHSRRSSPSPTRLA